jgi:hypothetical protein
MPGTFAVTSQMIAGKERCTLRELEVAQLALDEQEKEQLECGTLTFSNARKQTKSRIDIFPSTTVITLNS